MTRTTLFSQINKKQTYLCIGLDTDLRKIPKHLLKNADPVFEFNRQIIDATQEYCIAYKPNVAFYEAEGVSGWESLQKTADYIPKNIFSIADAKRGDIGNTSHLYARAFFEKMPFDAITVTPYMGRDAVEPFFQQGKWAILLVYTSNPGSRDFQALELKPSGRKLYEEVALRAQQWASPDQAMYVVGATREDGMAMMRSLAPDHFFLVPGVGEQGGSLAHVSKNGMNVQCGLLVNISRAILYASDGEDFAEKARERAVKIQSQMHRYLDMYL